MSATDIPFHKDNANLRRFRRQTIKKPDDLAQTIQSVTLLKNDPSTSLYCHPANEMLLL